MSLLDLDNLEDIGKRLNEAIAELSGATIIAPQGPIFDACWEARDAACEAYRILEETFKLEKAKRVE